MSTTTVVAAMAGSILLNLFVGGLFFWLACRLCRVPRVTYWRAVAVPAIITALWCVLALGEWYTAGESLGLSMLWTLAMLGMVSFVLKRGFRASAGKTVLVAIVGYGLTLVFSFGVALMVRAFLVEAFVVPTGAMATAIVGDHYEPRCEHCGLIWPVGTSSYHGPSVEAACPNCSIRVSFPASAAVIAGDRLLAEKLSQPKRWEPIVFKNPGDGTTNWVKRVVGMPGEILEIIDGDVYTAALDDLKAAGFPLDELEGLTREVHSYGQTQGGGTEQITTAYLELNRQLAPLLRIQRKVEQAPGIQERLWITLYNHDRVASATKQGDGPELSLGWVPEGPEATAAWNTSQPDVSLTQSEEIQYLSFVGKAIDDRLAYNGEWLRRPHNVVGDIRLRLVWLPDSADGSIVVRANRDEDTFVAEVLVDGTVTLAREQDGAAGHREVLATQKLTAFPVRQPVRIAFVNLDYRVSLAIDGRTVLETTDQQYSPDVPVLLSKLDNGRFAVRETKVRIGGRGPCRLQHIVLDRDIYHCQARQEEPWAGSSKTPNPYLHWPGWGTAGMPILLRPERQAGGRTLPAEYFVLGDNNSMSKDSRLWWQIGPKAAALGDEYQPGTVPADHLVGVVRCIYWPPNRQTGFN